MAATVSRFAWQSIICIGYGQLSKHCYRRILTIPIQKDRATIVGGKNCNVAEAVQLQHHAPHHATTIRSLRAA